jgi:hypothetical protein
MTAQLASVSDRILAHVEIECSAVRDSTILPSGTSDETPDRRRTVRFRIPLTVLFC